MRKIGMCCLWGMLFALLLFSETALAVTRTSTLEDSIVGIIQVTTFDEDLPAFLRQALDEAGYAEYRSYCGATMEWTTEGEEDPSSARQQALVAVEKDGIRMLLGCAPSTRQDLDVMSLGAGALLPGREFHISAMSRQALGSRCFTIVYPREGGGQESYAISYDTHWILTGYIAQDVGGRGISISTSYPYYGFRVSSLPWTGGEEVPYRERGTFYRAYVPLWPEEMDSIMEYPTSEEAAARIALESWKRFEGTDLVMVLGANLRTEPTGKSETLGEYNAGTLAHVLGEEPGRDAPWYHLRIGHVEGYMSGVYVHFPQTEDFTTTMWHLPLPKASAQRPCTLRQTPAVEGIPVMDVEAGTPMHVLTEMEGWLHVMVPRGKIGWEMDEEGVSGYLRVEDVSIL